MEDVWGCGVKCAACNMNLRFDCAMLAAYTA